MSADGTAAPAPTAAPAAPAGSTILTSGLPPPPPPPAPGSAEAAVQQVVDGPPEWAPAKYWDPEKKAVRTEDLGKAYINLEKLLGREKVPVPVNEDDKEGWDRFYSAAGRPEAPDKYELKRPDKLPDGMDYDEDLEANFRTFAHTNGLNNRQTKALYEGFVKHQVDRHSAWHTHQQQAKAQVQADLMRELGPQYEGAVGQAKAAMAKYADPEYIRMLEETGRGNDPREIRAWIRVGKELSGTTQLKGRDTPQVAPADLDAAITSFRKSNEAALNDRAHPDHKRASAEFTRLFEARFGTERAV